MWRLFTPNNVKHQTRKELEGRGSGTEGDEIWQLSSLLFVCVIISCAFIRKQRNVQLVLSLHWLLRTVFVHWPAWIRTVYKCKEQSQGNTEVALSLVRFYGLRRPTASEGLFLHLHANTCLFNLNQILCLIKNTWLYLAHHKISILKPVPWSHKKINKIKNRASWQLWFKCVLLMHSQ